jgi:hypothetical protein
LATEKRGARPRELVPPPDPERPDVLIEREKREALPAAIAAIASGVLALIGFVFLQTAGRNRPNNDPGRVLHYNDHATQILVGNILVSLGALASGYAMLYLYKATKGRRPQTINAARVCAIVGPVILAISQIAVQVVLLQKAHDFATTGSQTYEGAKDILDDGTITALATIALAGQLALGFAFVIISLNAMRAGLLTRFMGILGIIVGVLLVLPLAPSPIVQTVWLLSLGILFLGRWPSGVPPAWTEGRPIPWPSQQELREQAQAAKASERDEEPPDLEPEPATANGGGSAAKHQPQKRKRKRRR